MLMVEHSPGLKLLTVQLPGREERLSEPPCTRLSEVVEGLARALDPYLDQPFAFFGHSMGALISFEVTRRLRQLGKPQPVHLFVSAHRAPQLPSRQPALHRLPRPAFWREVYRLGGTPAEVLQNPELMELAEPLLRADFAICETYQYLRERALDTPVSVFGGRFDEWVSLDELAAWRDLTRGEFKLRMFASNHFFVHSARVALVRAIEADLQSQLDVQNRSGSALPSRASAA
jgi:medium-chain acyl-[acyl-carrier-protein] hydrolase